MIVLVENGLSGNAIYDLLHLARQGLPEEVCGTISVDGYIAEYDNISTCNRCHSFDMEIDLDDVGKIWHSHPNGPNCPSSDDIPNMESLFKVGYKFNWIIIGPTGVSEWAVE